jgi:putative IMPACT (imprinted ancient) family translation regulator
VKVTVTVGAKLTVERSRFFAVLFPAASAEDVDSVLRRQKGELRKANHHCWALLVRDAQGRVTEKAKDDGEVGHPGRVLLEILKKHDLEGGLLVSRVFGGVKLGVGGVSRAFREAGEMAAQQLSPAPTGRGKATSR